MRKFITLLLLLCFTVVSANTLKTFSKEKTATYETTINHPDIANVSTIVFSTESDWNCDNQIYKGLYIYRVQNSGFFVDFKESRHCEVNNSYQQTFSNTNYKKIEALNYKNKQTWERYRSRMHLRRVQRNGNVTEGNYTYVKRNYKPKRNYSTGYQNTRMGKAFYVGWSNQYSITNCKITKV